MAEKEIQQEAPRFRPRERRRPRGRRSDIPRRDEEDRKEWVPKTELGKAVVAGKYKTVDELLESGEIILEPEIVDYLIKGLSEEVIYIGGTPGKGGGIKRTATKMTARMHRSGRRFKITAVALVGDCRGVIGVGVGSSFEHVSALEKAIHHAKLSVARVRKGCGSWECSCGGEHSIPFRTEGKCGSLRVALLPAPKGTGMVADNETKKILRLAGIKDVWVKMAGQTGTRENLAFAVFEAIKHLNMTKGDM
jgi:small subunit ribosomal protein S5